MSAQEKAKACLEALGVQVSLKEKVLTGTFPSIYSVFESWAANKGKAGDKNKNTKAMSHNDADNCSFLGGPVQLVQDAMEGRTNLEPFLAARQKLQGQIQASSLCDLKGKCRKRRMSDKDGELDFDRLYDITPFNNTVIENTGAINIIDITFNFVFNAFVSSEQIAKYGTLAWAVVDLLETAGIQCNVTLRAGSESLYEKTSEEKKYETRIISVKLKEAGQYVDTLELARAFTPWFFRRCLWNAYATISESVGARIDEGLGHALKHLIEASPGKLDLGISILSGGNIDFNGLTKLINKALGRAPEEE